MNAPTPSRKHVTELDTVEYVRTFLMSFCTTPIDAAKTRCRRADRSDDAHRERRKLKNGVRARHHVNARRDHRRGMNDALTGVGPSHRVRQPT